MNYTKSNGLNLLGICSVSIIYTYIYNNHVEIEKLYSFYNTQYPKEIVGIIFEKYNTIYLLSYIFIPMWIIIRSSFFALCLDVVYALFNIDKEQLNTTKITFDKFWHIFIIGEWVLTSSIVIKFMWFGFFRSDYTYSDLIEFMPLSLYNILLYYNISVLDILKYPLIMINYIEIIYLFTITYFTYKILNVSVLMSIKLIVLSYGIVMFIITCLVIYLNFTLT